jgi:hypothetical protein
MAVKLADLHPQFVDHANRRGIGLICDCLIGHCSGKLLILFENPLDGGAPWSGGSREIILALFPDRETRPEVVGSGDCRWKRIGETFETLSLSPSVNAHECGHMSLSNGIFT